MELLDFLFAMSWIAALCLASGFLLVVIEMFHPGLSAPGISGAILLLLGVFLTAKSLMQALIMLLIILAILGVVLTIVLQSATKGRLSKILILSHAQKKESGYIGTEDLEFFLGQEGIAVTVLRPSGIADFNGVKLDVVSEGEFIQQDTPVKITKVQGRRIVVSEIRKG